MTATPSWLNFNSTLRPYGPDMAHWNLMPSWVGREDENLDLSLSLPFAIPPRLHSRWMESIHRVEKKRARQFEINYPELPILSAKEPFLKALSEHQIVMVCAGTGSGKSTQIPKFCLESGFASTGRIGMTQPRRIAATSIANRVTEELKRDDIVACQTRFHRYIPPEADIKVMTEGILLQEMRKDPWLWDYSVIILDEVHERSLSVDFLLGLIKICLTHRPDLRLILSSATLDTSSLRDFFPEAVLIEAEGRTFPVEIQYENENDDGDLSLVDRMSRAITGFMRRKADHLLAFLPTERDILELQRELEKDLNPDFYEILPLYSRLSTQEQNKVFTTRGKTKIILATNVAETSLTIPGIGIVVDSGLCRISRYQPQNRVQGLPIEPISQASAKQRAGRAGRTKAGFCLRMYRETDLANRPAYTDPEIRRSNLANVTIQLLAMGIHHLTDFALPDNPTPAQYRNAIRMLYDLEAVDRDELTTSITPLGRKLATIPLDVSLARMLLEGRHMRVLPELLPLIAAVSIQDPRIFPNDPLEKSRAQGLHSRFTHKKSDLLQIYSLFRWIIDTWIRSGNGSGKSQNRLRRLCIDNYLHYLHTREWIELWEQLRREWNVADEPLLPTDKLNGDAIHRSILSGLPGLVACNDPENRCYRLPGGREAFIFPGSCLKKQFPLWVASIGIRATSRTFLWGVFEIDPKWIEELWPHRCKREYLHPQYEPSRGFVSCKENVSYQGLLLPQSKRVSMERVDPEGASKVFWQQAIEEGAIRKMPLFHQQNTANLERMQIRASRIPFPLGLPHLEHITIFYQSIAAQVNSDESLDLYIKQNGPNTLLYPFDKELREAYMQFCEGCSEPTGSILDAWDKLFPETIEYQGFSLVLQPPKSTQDVWEIELPRLWMLWKIPYHSILIQIPGALYTWAHHLKQSGLGFPFNSIHEAVCQLKQQIQIKIAEKSMDTTSRFPVISQDFFCPSTISVLAQVLKEKGFELSSENKITWARLSMGLPDFKLKATGAMQKLFARQASPVSIDSSAISWVIENKPQIPPTRPGSEWQSCIWPMSKDSCLILGLGPIDWATDRKMAFWKIWQAATHHDARGKQRWKEEPIWKQTLRPLWESLSGQYRDLVLPYISELANHASENSKGLPTQIFTGHPQLGAWCSLWGADVFWAAAKHFATKRHPDPWNNLEPKSPQTAKSYDWLIASWSAIQAIHISNEHLSPVGQAFASLYTSQQSDQESLPILSQICLSSAWKKLKQCDEQFVESYEKKWRQTLENRDASMLEKLGIAIQFNERLRKATHLDLLNQLTLTNPAIKAPPEWQASQVQQLKDRFKSL